MCFLYAQRALIFIWSSKRISLIYRFFNNSPNQGVIRKVPKNVNLIHLILPLKNPRCMMYPLDYQVAIHFIRSNFLFHLSILALKVTIEWTRKQNFRRKSWFASFHLNVASPTFFKIWQNWVAIWLRYVVDV